MLLKIPFVNRILKTHNCITLYVTDYLCHVKTFWISILIKFFQFDFEVDSRLIQPDERHFHAYVRRARLVNQIPVRCEEFVPQVCQVSILKKVIIF